MGAAASMKKAAGEVRRIYVENKSGQPQLISYGRSMLPANLETMVAMVTGCDKSFPPVLKSSNGTVYAMDPTWSIPENDAGHPYKVQLLYDTSDQRRIFNSINQMQKQILEIREAVLSHRRTTDDINLATEVLEIPQINISDSLKEGLRSHAFNMWDYSYDEMLCFVEFMYNDMEVANYLQIHSITMRKFLMSVRANYRDVPFHNFRHAFSVTQMMYVLLSNSSSQLNLLQDSDKAALLIACVCHDLDHPGLTNNYQVKAKTDLAVRYNDLSPLENHHSSIAFRILANQDMNIFFNVADEDYRQIRKNIVSLILATDMANHNGLLKNFKAAIGEFDQENPEHKHLLMQIMIKVCDVSNEVRPTMVAERWLDCLLDEYFKQGDLELAEGLPVDSFMDRTVMTKPKAQIGFIRFVLIPLYESLGTLLSYVTDELVPILYGGLDYYENMGKRPSEPERPPTKLSKVEMEYEHLRQRAMSRAPRKSKT